MDEIVKRLLAAHGWTLFGSGHTALAHKVYMTAVGPKTAHAYLSGGDGTHRTLQGEYQSEGRNILEAWCRLLHINGTEERWGQEVATFSLDVDKVVGDSYAAKLLRK